MLHLNDLTDETLLEETDRLVHREREILSEILRHLREIEPVITAGELTLPHIGVAQALFSNEKKQGREFTLEKKAEVLTAISGQSVREAQKTLLRFAPEPSPRRDEIKPIAPGRSLVRAELSDDTLDKIERLRGLLAHEDSNLSLDELFSRLCDLGLQEWSPAREPQRKVKAETKAAIRRTVWQRDGGACTECQSTFAVEEDHLVPESWGGDYTYENIRLLCRSCNQRLKSWDSERWSLIFHPRQRGREGRPCCRA